MSHELRTPMNAILGFAQLLEQDPGKVLSDTHQSFVEEILRSGHHMMELINGVLDLAKVESGGIEFDMVPCKPQFLVVNCLKMVEAMAVQEGIGLVNKLSEDELPLVKVDILRLKQAVLNLLSNAIKYNKPGGEIIVECNHNDKQMLQILVTDTGVGLTVTKQLIEGMGVRSALKAQLAKARHSGSSSP